MGTYHWQASVTDARFFAYHGYYPEEQLLGNEFSVDVRAAFECVNLATDELDGTINYERLYRIAEEEMQRPRKLLETVADAIVRRVRDEFRLVTAIDVRIVKTQPPFGGDQAKAAVALAWKR